MKPRKKKPPERLDSLRFYSETGWRPVYDKEDALTQKEEWIVTLSTLASVIDRKFFDSSLFKDARLVISVKPIHVKEFYRYHKTQRDGRWVHYLSIDERILSVNDDNFGNFREGIIHILVRAICEIAAKEVHKDYEMHDGLVKTVSEVETVKSNNRSGGGAVRDREEHHFAAKTVRKRIHFARKASYVQYAGAYVYDLDENPRKMTQVLPTDTMPEKAINATKIKQKESSGSWKRSRFFLIKNICGYVPKNIRFVPQGNNEGVYVFKPSTLSCRRRK